MMNYENVFKQLIEACEKLAKCESLSPFEDKRVKKAVETLKEVQSISRRRRCQEFLYEILEKTNSNFFFICALGLNLSNITDLKASERRLLARRLCSRKNDSAFDHASIRLFAKSYQVPSSTNGMSNVLEFHGKLLISLDLPDVLRKYFNSKALKVAQYPEDPTPKDSWTGDVYSLLLTKSGKLLTPMEWKGTYG